MGIFLPIVTSTDILEQHGPADTSTMLRGHVPGFPQPRPQEQRQHCGRCLVFPYKFVQKDLTYTVETADALKSTVFGYQKWQMDSHNFDEKALPAFEGFDTMQTLLASFGTLFCNTEAEVPGSEYEAM